MNLPVSELPAAEVVAAVKANWADFYAHVGRVPVAELSVGPHLSWLLTGVPDPFLNVVFRTDLPSDRVTEIVDEALRHFRSRHVARLSWWADWSGADPGQHLLRRGLTFDASGTAMAADLRSVDDTAPTPAGLVVAPVEDRTTLQRWIQVMSVGFGISKDAESRLLELFATVALEPPMQTYLALLDGRPVATSQLFVGAGVAGIYSVTCLPDARGRGIGTAVSRAPMLEASRQGCDLAVLQASPSGFPVYRRLGFHDYGRIGTYQFTLEEPG
jgi:ribosomal protein S18 acetylase RimI-like enzyme